MTVIVNRSASSGGSGSGDNSGDGSGEALIDPVVEAIEAAEGDEVTFAQREVPVVTSEMLNALRLSGKTSRWRPTATPSASQAPA